MSNLEKIYNPVSPISRFYSECAYLPRCSDENNAVLVRPREFAMQHPYMQANRQDMVSWLIFDIDHNNPLIWDDVGLPAPNLVVRDPQKNSSHIYYAIHPVCTSLNAKPKPIAYMKRIQEQMIILLKADPSYRGPVAKTPGHPNWITSEYHNDAYSLHELAEYLEFDTHYQDKQALELANDSRHCTLFEITRFYAYANVRQYRASGNYESFHRAVNAYAQQNNQFIAKGFDANLSLSQVRATVRSIARWTWDKYFGSGSCNRGEMNLHEAIPLATKQRLSAKRTHNIKINHSQKALKDAFESAMAIGARLTNTFLAKLSGLSRQTVAKHRHLFEQNIKQTAIIETHKPVNFAVHQITAVNDPKFNSAGKPEMFRNNKVSTVNKEFVHKWFWNNKVCTQRLSHVIKIAPSQAPSLDYKSTPSVGVLSRVSVDNLTPKLQMRSSIVRAQDIPTRNKGNVDNYSSKLKIIAIKSQKWIEKVTRWLFGKNKNNP